MGIKNTIRKAVDTARDLLDDGKLNGSIYNNVPDESSEPEEDGEDIEEFSTTTVRGAEVLEDGRFRFNFGSGQPVRYREPEFGLEIGVNFNGTAVARAKDYTSVPVDDAKARILDEVTRLICKEPVKVAELPAMCRRISDQVSRCFNDSGIELTQFILDTICPDNASCELLEQKRREMSCVSV